MTLPALNLPSGPLGISIRWAFLFLRALFPCSFGPPRIA